MLSVEGIKYVRVRGRTPLVNVLAVESQNHFRVSSRTSAI
jgi:hypothetical protein